MIHDPLDHEKRAREIADSTRRFIIGANAGAIAAVLAAAGKLMDATPTISPRWALEPLVWFVLSLAMVYTSLVLAKGRELARLRRAIALDHKPGDVSGERVPLLKQSSFWDTYAALVLAFGVVWAFRRLYLLLNASL
jgi:hypothetical protein